MSVSRPKCIVLVYLWSLPIYIAPTFGKGEFAPKEFGVPGTLNES